MSHPMFHPMLQCMFQCMLQPTFEAKLSKIFQSILRSDHASALVSTHASVQRTSSCLSRRVSTHAPVPLSIPILFPGREDKGSPSQLPRLVSQSNLPHRCLCHTSDDSSRLLNLNQMECEPASISI